MIPDSAPLPARLLEDCLAEGRRHISQANYRDAMNAYRTVVLLDPGSKVAAVNLLGLKGLRPELDVPGVVIRTVGVLAPDNPTVSYNRAEALRVGGLPGEAVPWFKRSVVLRPQGQNAWLKLAAAFATLDRADRLDRHLRQAYALGPTVERVADAYAERLLERAQWEDALAALQPGPDPSSMSVERIRLQARALIGCDRIEEAFVLLRTGMARDPLDQGLWMLRALGKRNLGQIDESVQDGRRSLLINPRTANALNQHAMTCLRHADVQQGIDCLRRYKAAHPSRSLAADGLIGSGLMELGRSREGLHHIRKGCLVSPGNAEGWSNLCAAYVSLQEIDPARTAALRGRMITEASAGLIYNQALVERFSRRFSQAMANLDAALALAPDDPVYRFTASLLELADGDTAKGIAHHRHRWRMPKFSAVRRMEPSPELPVPVWDGGPLSGTLAVWGEQGVGDELWFAGYLDRAIALVDHVILEVPGHMVTLMQRSFPSITVVPRDHPETETQLRKAAAQRPIGDLFDMFFRPDHPVPSGYLKPDLGLAHDLRARYLRDSEAGTRLIGISWKSRKGIAKRSFAAPIEQWGSVLAPPSDQSVWGTRPVRFVNLQYGEVERELERAQKLFGIRVEHDSEVNPLRDLDAAAAQVLAMDGVISIANATVALAHGLGRSCAVATRIDQDDWRYPRLSARSRWLPTVRHFWQTVAGDWSQPLRTAAAAEADRLAKHPGA